jgi:hypothetical protein
MCRSAIREEARLPLARMLTDMAERLAEIHGVDPADVRCGPVDFGDAEPVTAEER